MKALRNIQLRWLYRLNGQLETKIETYYNQSTSLVKFRTYGKKVAIEKGWRFVDAIVVDDRGRVS